MDTLTLSLVIIMFLASLALYFATASPVIPTPCILLPEKPAPCVTNIRISLLKQNVAVGKFVRNY